MERTDHPREADRTRGPATRALLGFVGWPAGVLVAVVLMALVFEEVLFAGRLYYPGDMARVYLPQRAALHAALRVGRLPWWSPHLGAGYPLLAEGQAGALYPLNWALVLLPAEVASSVAIVTHYALLLVGYLLFTRALGLSRLASLFGAMVVAFGGYGIAHLSHLPILATSAWLPWVLWLSHRVLLGARRRVGGAALALAAALALQLLAGHAQMVLLGGVVVGAYCLTIAGGQWRYGAGRRRWALWGAAILVGVVVAAPQLVASAELTRLSQRAGGLDAEFFVSYSFHPLLIATFLSPFAAGNPYPLGSVELMAYAGLLPLTLAALASIRWQHRLRGLWLVLAGLGLFLALGRWNPLYVQLSRLPLLNLFRVPARYLYWWSLGVGVLASAGFDLVTSPNRTGRHSTARADALLLGGLTLGAGALVLFVRSAEGVDRLVDAWRWLPLGLAGAVAMLAVVARRVSAPSWAVAALLLVGADLYAYQGVLARTYNATWPSESVVADVRSVELFVQNDDLFRIYTKEEILPDLGVQRESLYPNIALLHGLDSANLYLPLVPRAYADYIAAPSPARLNRLNVRYYLIPQLLPVDEASELYDVQNPFSALPVNRWLEFDARSVAGLVVDSFLSHAADLETGTLVAEVLLRDDTGQVTALPLRAGIETAEWAYPRSDVRATVRHQLPPQATSFPARSGFPPEEHLGLTFRAELELEPTVSVVALQLRLYRPEAFVRIEQVLLRSPQGQEWHLGNLLGLGRHTIAYRSEDVLIYRNDDAWPRAYVVPAGYVTRDGDALALSEGLAYADLWPAQVREYEAMRVVIEADLPAAGYLVLADLAYPGWQVEVDGRCVALLTVDGVFRGVPLEAGSHRVEMTYIPPWWWRRHPAACIMQ